MEEKNVLPTDAQTMSFDEQEEELRKYDTPPLRNVGYFVRVFSFKGRITRTEYVLSHLVAPCYFFVLYFASLYADISSFFIGQEGAEGTYDRIVGSCVVVTTWFYIAQGVKRCHDVGWTGWCIYIPFVNLLMLFKRGTGEVNAYGLPPVKQSADTAFNERMRIKRQRGCICSLLWLVCSPAWLYMTVRWRIQRRFARFLLFFISPFWVTLAYTAKECWKNHQLEEVREERVCRAVGKAVTGFDFKISDVESVSKPTNYGAETYIVTLSAPPSDILLSQIELLATVKQSGWSAYANEGLAREEDYGHYRADYGQASDSLDQPNEVYVFAKEIKLKGDKQNSRLTLRLQRGEKTAEVVIAKGAGQ